MERFLYAIALILVVIWAIGFFLYSLGAFIHAALLLAFLIIVLRLVFRRRPRRESDRIR